MVMIVAPTSGYNSFVSLTWANEFHSDRANTAWSAATTAARNAALIRATDHILTGFDFSTAPIIDGVVNPLVLMATAVLASYALAGPLHSVRDERAVIESEEELEGAGRIKTRYSEHATGDRYPAVTTILAPLASPKSAGFVIGKISK